MIDQETLTLFNELYASTYQAVLTYVACNCNNAEDVKDIVQEIYVAVLIKLQNHPDVTINQAYIMGIARNKVKSYYRFQYKQKIISLFSKRNHREDRMLIDEIPADMDIEADVFNKEDIAFIWKFLCAKKAVVFKIFYLYYYLDLTIKETAAQLHMNESTVKTYLYRTLKELQAMMKERGDENDE